MDSYKLWQLLLLKVNTGRKIISDSEIEDDDSFVFSSSKDFRSLLQIGIIRELGSGKYEITADISELRNYILTLESLENIETETAADPLISYEEIITSKWKFKEKDLLCRPIHSSDDDFCFDEKIKIKTIKDLKRSLSKPTEELDGLKAAIEKMPDYYIDVLQLCVREGGVSISSIRRNFPMGFGRAGVIVEWFIEKGIISDFGIQKKSNLTIADFIYMFREEGDFDEDEDVGDDEDEEGEDECARQYVFDTLIEILKDNPEITREETIELAQIRVKTLEDNSSEAQGLKEFISDLGTIDEEEFDNLKKLITANTSQ